MYQKVKAASNLERREYINKFNEKVTYDEVKHV